LHLTFGLIAFLEQGFSGGPLLDSRGRVIGVNIGSFGAVGDRGLAVPVDTVSRVVKQIIEHGEAFSPSIGITGLSGTIERSETYRWGVVVLRVIPNSPAAFAGLEPFSDVIVGIDGVLTDIAKFRTILDAKSDGDIVELIVSRQPEDVEVIEVVSLEIAKEKDLNRQSFDEVTMSRKKWASTLAAFDGGDVQEL